MQCPKCQAEAGAAEFCPSCLTALPKAPADPAPAPTPAPAAAAAPARDQRRQMFIYGGLLMVAVSIGFSGAALYEHLSNPAVADDACLKLCEEAAEPRRWTDAAFQKQLEEHRCHCAPPAAKAEARHTPNGAAPVELQALPKFDEDKAVGPLKMPPPGPAAPVAPTGR